MSNKIIPEFAVVGHPNEGKSSVVSTLAEDDSVRVSPIPGETVLCRTFPVVIDGWEIIRFTDTPGFQNPIQTLEWMRNYRGDDTFIVEAFRETHAGNPNFRDDVELFKPITNGAGIIYVVDGSRPLRRVDKAEMEVLRLTGRPRMAIINCKENETGYLDQWKNEFRKHFNSVRIFNAHKATYAERLELLDTLKSIDQDWRPALETVISAFKTDWENRNAQTAEIICALITDCLTFSINRGVSGKSEEEALELLRHDYTRSVEKIEKESHQRIRRLFKHNIFNYDLPAQSILQEELFNEKTWQFLGLTQAQLIAAASLAGGALGALIDLAAAGLTFGIFTAILGLAGAGWAAMGGGKKLAKAKVVGVELGTYQIQVGPIDNMQFPYILADRALIFYSHIINWAHGRRDYPKEISEGKPEAAKQGVTAEWTDQGRRIGSAFFAAVRSGDDLLQEHARREMKAMLKETLYKLSNSERRYGLILKN
jgi:hypothetical protein